jgi:hypothetical protein
VRRADYMPFILALTFFASGFTGWGARDLAEPVVAGPDDLEGCGAACKPGLRARRYADPLPAVLGYTWWSYSVLRGRVAAESALTERGSDLDGSGHPAAAEQPFANGLQSRFMSSHVTFSGGSGAARVPVGWLRFNRRKDRLRTAL